MEYDKGMCNESHYKKMYDKEMEYKKDKITADKVVSSAKQDVAKAIKYKLD